MTRTVDANGVVTLRIAGRTWFCEITPEGVHGFSVAAFVYGRELSRYSSFRPYYKTVSGAERAACLWFAKRLDSSGSTLHRSAFPIVTDPSPEMCTAND